MFGSAPPIICLKDMRGNGITGPGRLPEAPLGYADIIVSPWIEVKR